MHVCTVHGDTPLLSSSTYLPGFFLGSGQTKCEKIMTLQDFPVE